MSTTGRVRVGVRCRPPFQDEIDFAQGNFFSIVECADASIMTAGKTASKQDLAKVNLTLLNGNQREFLYDYAFDMNTSQDAVYERVGRPVVSDVLKGFNGTIFAYGQTGTGKTYTMGILDFVDNKHAGIIPRALAQVFDSVSDAAGGATEGMLSTVVTISFLQLYRETIQDLLAPATQQAFSNQDDTGALQVREDPARGFYVDGLQEFIVRSYSEAETLVNLGLENRAIAPTLMNSTSSRSHTVLTLTLAQKGVKTTDSSGGEGLM